MRGLVNLGNSCYFNTALQCLLHAPPIVNYFTHVEDEDAARNESEFECTFTNMFAALARKMWTKGQSEPLNPKVLVREFQKHFPRFTDDEEHDAQEAILCIIDILERAAPDIKEYIYGEYAQQIVYPKGKKQTREPFAIHIVTSDGDSLKDMLTKDTAWRVLTDYVDDEGETYHCATTRRVFSKLPRMLMLSFDKKTHCSVVERLKIGERKYRLVAAAVHHGIQWAGHYGAYTYYDKKWYLKDDDTVEELPGGLPEKAGYYVLVYTLN